MDQNDILSNVTSMTSELALHVRDAFGPLGKHVLVVDDVGNVMLTKNGSQILKALRCVDPFARMIVRSIASLVDTTGDGSKTFLLLFSTILSSICTGAPSNPATRRNKMKEARLSLLSLRRYLWHRRDSIRHLFARRAIPFDWEMKTVSRLFSSHLRSGSVVQRKACKLLADILAQFVYARKDGSMCSRDDLDFILKHFSHFCVKEVGRSIENTRLLSALLLSRSFTSSVSFPTTKENIQSVFHDNAARVISGCDTKRGTGNSTSRLSSSSSAPSSPNSLLLIACPLTPVELGNDLSCELHLDRLYFGNNLAKRSRIFAAVVERLRQLGVTAIVSKFAVSPSEKAALSAAGIFCVEHLSSDEMFWLAELCNCQRLLDIQEIFREDMKKYLLHYSGSSVLTVGSEDRLLLGDLVNKFADSPLQPRHIILSSPTTATCESLERAAIACLKQLRSMMSHQDDSCILLACGGFFEVFLTSILSSSVPESSPPFSLACPSSSTLKDGGSSSSRFLSSLARESPMSRLSTDLTKDIDPATNDNVEHLDDDSLRSGVSFLTEALLSIPAVIHQNSISSDVGTDRLVSVMRAFEEAVNSYQMFGIDAMSGSLYKVDCRVMKPSDNGSISDKSGLEYRGLGSVSSLDINSCDLESYDEKMATVIGVLDLAILMLNIEKTVCVKEVVANATDGHDKEKMEDNY